MREQTQKIDYFFNDISSLHAAYMPFVKGGGLFIRAQSTLMLGTQVILSIHLLNELEQYTIETKVVWLTPAGAQGNKPTGMGMQFIGKNSSYFRNKIESHLIDMLELAETTDTI